MRELTTPTTAQTTELTIDGRRHRLDRSADRHLGWLPIEAKLWERRQACARCERLTRWAGLWWCGTPLVVRVRYLIGDVARASIAASLGSFGLTAGQRHFSRGAATRDVAPGCGCCLNLKWNMIVHPRWRIAQAWAWLTGWITGEECVDRHHRPEVLSCPLGKWPSICV